VSDATCPAKDRGDKKCWTEMKGIGILCILASNDIQIQKLKKQKVMLEYLLATVL
jgi:hypothetical protein